MLLMQALLLCYQEEDYTHLQNIFLEHIERDTSISVGQNIILLVSVRLSVGLFGLFE